MLRAVLPRMLALLGSIACVLSWIPACNAIVGISPREPAQVACGDCVAKSCAAEVSACRDESICSARVDCDSACDVNDDACLSACDNPPSAGSPDLAAAVDTCRADSCAGPCAVHCGDLTTPTPTASASACTQCAANNCCVQEQACASNEDCRRIRECLRDHNSADAVSNCTAVRYPAGTDDWQHFDACITATCAQECALGTLWSCVGHVKAPLATSDTVTVTYTFTDAQAQSHGVADLRMRGCRTNDVTCVTPVTATSISDATGTASLVLPTAGPGGARTGFDGYIEIIDPKNVYITSLLFSGVPIVEDVSLRKVVLIASADLAALTKFAGIVPDPQHGYVASAVTDCAARLAPRATVVTDTFDTLTKGFYTRSGIFSPGSTDTDAQGLVAFVNVPAGLLTMKATSEDIGRVTSVVSASVRPGALSLVQLTPTSRE